MRNSSRASNEARHRNPDEYPHDPITTRIRAPRATHDFARRHIGPGPVDEAAMLAAIGLDSMEALIDEVIPPAIRSTDPLGIGAPRTESEVLQDLRRIASRNQVFKSFIGMGYHDCHTPPVIQRNILENPAWYTAYTPYQPEISQGRLEALLNFQTMIADLTGLEIANASHARRRHGRRRSDGFCQRVSKSRSRHVLRLAGLPSADDRSRAHARRAGRRRGRGRRSPAPISTASMLRRAAAIPRLDGRGARLRRHRRPGARGRRARGRRRRPARADPAHAARRVRRRCRRRQRAAVRCPDGLRRPARGLSSRRATRTNASCQAASSACRSTARATRPTASPCKRASSTSAARRRPATSARRRCCSP